MKLKKELRAVKEINEQERKKRDEPGDHGHDNGEQDHDIVDHDDGGGGGVVVGEWGGVRLTRVEECEFTRLQPFTTQCSPWNTKHDS